MPFFDAYYEIPTSFLRYNSSLILTDKVIEAEKGSGEFTIVLHYYPDTRANACIDELLKGVVFQNTMRYYNCLSKIKESYLMAILGRP